MEPRDSYGPPNENMTPRGWVQFLKTIRGTKQYFTQRDDFINQLFAFMAESSWKETGLTWYELEEHLSDEQFARLNELERLVHERKIHAPIASEKSPPWRRSIENPEYPPAKRHEPDKSAELKEELEQLREERVQMTEEINHLKMMLAKKTEEVEMLQKNSGRASKDLDRAMGDMADKDKQVVMLKGKNKKLQNALDKILATAKQATKDFKIKIQLKG